MEQNRTRAPSAPQICCPSELPDIPPALRQRLALAPEAVVNLRQWKRLSPRRKAGIFGITPSHVRLLDKLARGLA